MIDILEYFYFSITLKKIGLWPEKCISINRDFNKFQNNYSIHCRVIKIQNYKENLSS